MTRLISVKVHPKASRDRVLALGENSYEVWTTAAPERNAANSAVRRLLADTLGVPQSAVLLRRGHTSRHKVFEVG